MLRLPARVTVQLVDSGGHALRASGILVSINTLVDGHYYYGNLVGLTDEGGLASIDRHELDLRFAADRGMFPMDYKVAFEECDPLIEVSLMSQAELAEARAAIASSSFISEDIRKAYAVASNELYRPSRARVWADLPNEPVLLVTLATNKA